jgi:hypothetical protein
MIRTALDSDQLTVFGPITDFILTYSDLVTDPAGFEKDHPGKQVVYIDRGIGDPDDKASIIDAETGAYRYDQVADWYDRKAHAHVAYLTYYCDRSGIPSVESNLNGRRMYRWIATLDGTLHVAAFAPLAGPDLVQFANSAAVGIHADMSLVFNPGWHPSPADPKLAQMTTIAADASRDLAVTAGRMSSLSAMINAMQ